MKKVRIYAAIALAPFSLTLASCDLPPLDKPPLAETTVDEKALFVAETAFAGASEAIEAGVDSGLIKGETAATVDTYYTQAKAYLDVARQAQTTGDSASVMANAILVQELVAKIFAALKS